MGQGSNSVRSQECRGLIAQYHRCLETEIQRREVAKEIERLKETYPLFRKYASTEELVALIRPGNPAYTDKDAVLTVLLAEIKRKPTLFPLLNLVLWDGLCNIFWRKHRACLNPDDLFSRIQAEFFHVAIAYPLDRRPRKIDVNLILDTKKKITAWQREEARYCEQHRPLEPTHEGGMAPADVRESEAFPEEKEAYLLDLVYRHVIDETQYDLLVETEVYKRMTQKEWAEARGVPYATVRSWRHRAEKAIREYEKGRRR